MRRLIVILVVAAVMAATIVGGIAQAANAQQGPGPDPGQTQYCGPTQQSWYISSGGWWYFWNWKWCYNPSIQGGWFVDWRGWGWYGPADPPYTPGYQYSAAPGNPPYPLANPPA